VGVLEIQRFFQKIRITKPEKWVSFLIILSILAQLPQILRPERRHREEQETIGIWLKQNTPKDAIIMSNSTQEAFYANREFIMLPYGISTQGRPGKSYKEIIHFAREKGIRYILVNKNTVEMNPDFRESIQESDLREFYRYQSKDGNLTIVYEVVN
jgi:hypothetical protein